MTDPLLEQLREQFRETSRARIAEMNALAGALAGNAGDSEAVQKLARHFHALAGLGATYGYPLVSEIGDEAEGAILPFARGGHPPPRETVARWIESIARIADALREEGSDVDIGAVAGGATPRRILAIEDDATHAVLIRHVLSTAGYEVAVCTDPVLFDEALAAFGPDLLLADVQIDDRISGYDLVRRARSTARFRTLPVIFVTGERDRGAPIELTAEGDPLVPKPVDWERLLSLIAQRV